MTFAITSIIAAAAAAILLILSIQVVMRRASTKVGIMYGDDLTLAARMRRQANLAEYAPVVLILLAIAENTGAPALALWIVGAVFIGARLLHPFGITPDRADHPLRIMGATLTFLSMAALIVLVLWMRLGG